MSCRGVYSMSSALKVMVSMAQGFHLHAPAGKTRLGCVSVVRSWLGSGSVAALHKRYHTAHILLYLCFCLALQACALPCVY